MKTHEMVSAVQKSARIPTHDEAERAVKSTLTVLGQRLGSEKKDLAAQLPPELAVCLTESGDTVDRFDLEEFYDRVAQAEGGQTRDHARQHSRAVMAALRESVGAEYVQAIGQLPNDYGDLTQSRKGEYPADAHVPRE